MKTSHTLLFILSVFVLLGVIWFVFPEDGVVVGNTSLRFPSYTEARKGQQKELDVDSVLNNVSKSYEMSVSETLLDSLNFYRDYLTVNPNRIYLPENDFTYFDSLFYLLDHARENKKIYRVMHYGDSQIEMDRITSVLRQRMQEMFGGSGPNMISAIHRISSISLSQSHSGNILRYAMIGDSTSYHASHNRYGVMTQFCQVSGQATVSFSISKNSNAYPKVHEISTISILLGNNKEGFKASLKAGDYQPEPQILQAKPGPSLIHWELPTNVERGTITFQGNAEIYAVMLDGDYGVAVDNNALRGCAGTLFTRINKDLMKESFQLLDTRLIILQFGGNRMPGISGTKSIVNYINELENQIQYFKEVAPQATLLFIGPADMGKSYNGRMTTWKGLPELNDSLKAMSIRNDIAYWDMFHVMGGEGSMAQYVKHNPKLGNSDYIHFTFLGAQEIGNYLAKSIIIYYDFYKLRQRIPYDYIVKFMNQEPKLNEPKKETQKTTVEPIKYYYE